MNDSLLSHTQVRRWSYLFYVMAIACVGLAHVLEHKELRVSIAICLWVSVAFFYCTQSKALPIVGLYELVFALATGPVVMLSATYLLVGKLNWSVCGYSYLVMLVTWAYLVGTSSTTSSLAIKLTLLCVNRLHRAPRTSRSLAGWGMKARRWLCAWASRPATKRSYCLWPLATVF